MACGGSMSEDDFRRCVGEIVELSSRLQDGWTLQKKQGTDSIFMTKKSAATLLGDDKKEVTVTFEYHVAYHPSYCVPVLAFMVWKQDGTVLGLEEFWKLNVRFGDNNMYETLTQMDHPVLQKPILTLHPCRTNETIQPFLRHSKNPVISWLTTVGPFVQLEILNEYMKAC